MYYAISDTAEEVALIDWQFVSWGNPLTDVALLIYSSVDADVRRTYEEALLQYYHSELITFLSKREQLASVFSFFDVTHRDCASRYSYECCYEDYKEARCQAFIQTISSLDAFLGPPAASQEAEADPGQAIIRLIEMTKDLAADGVL